MTTRREFMHAAAIAAALRAIGISPAAFAQNTGVNAVRPILRWRALELRRGTPSSIKAWASPPAVWGGNAMIVKVEGKSIVVDSKSAWAAACMVHDNEHFTGNAMGQGNTFFVNTHHHGDHVQGNALFDGKSKSFCHERAIDRIKAQTADIKQKQAASVQSARRALENATSAEPVLSDPGSEGGLMEKASLAATLSGNVNEDAVTPDEHVGDGSVVLDGIATPVSLVAGGPGHTDNDVSVWFKELNLLHVGDLVFNGLHPFFDAAGGVSVDGWIQSVKNMLDLADNRTIVVPGHGPVTNRRGLETQLAYLTSLRDNVKQQIAAGKSRADVVQMSWPFMNGLGFERFREIAIGVAYDQYN